MSKLAILGGVLFLAVAASAYKTTITTVEVDKDDKSWDWKEPWGCSQKLQKVDLSQCERYISQKVRSGDDDDDDNVVLRMRTALPQKSKSSSSEDCEEQCCEQLREISEPRCQCRAFQQIMQRQSQELQGKEQMQEMVRELRRLPRKCDLPNEEQIRKCIPSMGF